uniref:C2 domain-containing protein n=1 Tax=Ananas comosus var. bracteatus TaxID=296719 RepID=A0A6V7P680_ANACO|nr:unnamed protein product [Ananas comosus var. bracteatus]
MSHSHGLANLKFEIKVGKLTNFKREVEGNLFIRYYFFAGNNRRISVDTREIVSTNDPCWSELALFECSGNSDHINELLESRNVVFELRRRRTLLFERFRGSELLGRGELAWKDVLGSRDISLEKCVKLLSARKASKASSHRVCWWRQRLELRIQPIRGIRRDL